MDTHGGTGRWRDSLLTRSGARLLLSMWLAAAGSQALAIGCPATLAGGPGCGVEPVGSHSPPAGDARFVANPVDVMTGDKIERRLDWRAFGSRLSFERHYRSSQGDTNRGLGGGWRHGLDLSLMRLPDGAGLRLVQGDGRAIDFLALPQDDRVWTSDRDGRVELGTGAYIWQVPDGRRIRFTGVRPVRIDWPDGDRLTMEWEQNRLIGMTDTHGRRIELHWTPGRRSPLSDYLPVEETAQPGHLDSVSLPDGTRLTYRYDNLHRLRTVYRDETLLERIDYDEEHPGAMSAMHDREGSRRWLYDPDARVRRFIADDGRTLDFTYRDLPAEGTAQRGETVMTRADGMHVDHRWRIDAKGRGTLDRVIEYPCSACTGEPRDITPPSAPPDPPRDTVLDGVRVTRFEPDRARVRIEALDAEYELRFDRRAAVRSIGPIAGEPPPVTDARQRRLLDRVRRDLDASTFVDDTGLVHRSKSSTTSVCPLAIVRSCEELNHDIEMARLSKCAYETGPCPYAGEWEALDASHFGLAPADLRNRYLNAVAYRHAGTGEIVMAFRGTATRTDVATDLNQFEGRPTEAYRQARELALILREGGHDVTYTGHSLGAGLATLAALTGREQAYGFNSASLVEATAQRHGLDLADADRFVTHLLVPGEAVTVLQETPMRDPSTFGLDNDYDRVTPDWETHPAPGRRDVLADPSREDIQRAREALPGLVRGLLPASGEESSVRHMMDLVISSLHATLVARCSHSPPIP